MAIFEILRSKIEDTRSTFSVQTIFSDDNNFFFLVVTLEPISNDNKQRRASRVFILIEQQLQVFLVIINLIHN